MFENKKKVKVLRNIIGCTIDYIERNSRSASCKNDILSVYDKSLKGKEKQAKDWDKNFNYEFNAYKFIYNCAFDLLTSGRYHIYAGELNPMGPASNLYKACVACLDYYVRNGYASEEDKKEQLDYLREQIKLL